MIELDLNNFAKGIYVIQIQSRESVIRKKLLIIN